VIRLLTVVGLVSVPACVINAWWPRVHNNPRTIPGATAQATRTSRRRFIDGANAKADTVKPAAQTNPRGLARERAMLATTRISVVDFGQASDPSD
jgi:hypothetical protein